MPRRKTVGEDLAEHYREPQMDPREQARMEELARQQAMIEAVDRANQEELPLLGGETE